MDGYAERDWDTLRESMLECWDKNYSKIKYTKQDLINMAEEYSKKGGIKDIKEFKYYLTKFNTIVKYLLYNEHIYKRNEVSYIFLAAFSKESQKDIQRELIREKRIPHGRDGYSKSPALQDVTQAAENEVQAEFEEAYITTNFSEANKAMQKTLDKKKGTREKREKMVEENPPSQLEG